MKLAIVEKLDKFLGTHVPFKEECEAVYLMVELRKLLDIEKEVWKKIHGRHTYQERFPILRFYCDWTVHTAKTKPWSFTPPIKYIMSRINELLAPFPQDHNTDFLFLPELRAEMTQLFDTYGLSTKLCSDEDAWKYFLSIFVQVLADQPMENPIPAISSFCFVPSNPGQVFVEIAFTDYRAPLCLGIDDIF